MSPLEGLGTTTTSSGSEPIVEITPVALAKLVELRDAEPDADGLGLRLELASGPGEDFRYDLSFDEYLSAAFTDEVRTHDGLKVIIPQRDLEPLQGATLDYTEPAGLVIRNPNRPSAPVIEGLTTDDALSAEIEALVAGEVNPALAAHGGFVDLRRPRRRGHGLHVDGRRLPWLLDEPRDDARRRADDAPRVDPGRRAGQGPHRPHDRREPLLLLTAGRTLGLVRRCIVGFEVDDVGDWAARLDCHHRQHIRHRPPFRTASWIDVEAERARRIGTTLQCPLCDRCELPADLVVVRTTATWDETTLPAALRRAHRVASGTWGRLRVVQGSLRFVAMTDPMTDVVVDAHLPQAIPPGVEHHVEPLGPTRLAIDFLGPER